MTDPHKLDSPVQLPAIIDKEIADLGIGDEVNAQAAEFEANGGMDGLVRGLLWGDFSWGPGLFSRSKCYSLPSGCVVHVKPDCRCRSTPW